MDIDENGVVHPLRPPRAIAAFGGRVAALPRLAIAFLFLAAIDLIVGIVRLRGFSITLGGEVLTILLPVAVLWRRADAPAVTPGVLRGAALIATGALASRLLGSLGALLVVDSAGNVLDGPDPLIMVRDVVVSALDVAGWAVLARSVAGLRPAGAGALRLVASVLAIVAVGTEVASLALAFGSGATAGSSVANVLVVMESLSMAVVIAAIGWVFVTRAGGLPRLATGAAAIGAGIWATHALPNLVVNLSLASSHAADDDLTFQGAAIWFLLAGGVAAIVLFLAAFATGLADPPATARRGRAQRARG